MLKVLSRIISVNENEGDPLMNTFGKRFKTLCEYTNLSDKGLEEHLNMPIEKIKALQNDKYQFTVTEEEIKPILKSLKFFGIDSSLNWLVFGTGKAPHRVLH